MSMRKHVYSQHFLKSPRMVAELIGHSNIRKNDTVYDLGAGSGVISAVLSKRCKQVMAVEIEPEALKKLTTNLASAENVTILNDDILAVEIPRNPYKIFANIPFSISADVVRKYTETDYPPKSMYIICQKQFARKLVPGQDHFTSQLSAQIAPWFTVRVRKPLRKSDFTPPPAVDTVLLEIKPRDEPLFDKKKAAHYREFIELCFTRQKYFASLTRESAGISAEKRPSQLSVEQWLKLYATIKA